MYITLIAYIALTKVDSTPVKVCDTAYLVSSIVIKNLYSSLRIITVR